MKKHISIILLVMGASINIRAQGVGPATVNAAGGQVITGTTELEWSVGEMTRINTVSMASLIVTEGVLQPSDVALSVPAGTLAGDKIDVFPNPASSQLHIRLAAAAGGSLEYRLTDMHGRVITNKEVNYRSGTLNEEVNMAQLANATYMLEVILNGEGNKKETSTYKIDKVR